MLFEIYDRENRYRGTYEGGTPAEALLHLFREERRDESMVWLDLDHLQYDSDERREELGELTDFRLEKA